jgi:hypothetical protein
MARPDLYLDTSGDVTVAPRPYFSADLVLVRAIIVMMRVSLCLSVCHAACCCLTVRQALRAQKAQVLQNHWRGYCARKLAWEVRMFWNVLGSFLHGECVTCVRIERNWR